MNKLTLIQSELKAPKNQFNSFGKYKYRSCEDILEALKPVLAKHGCTLVITDEVKEIGGIVFCESTAIISDGKDEVSVRSQAGIDPNRKGMDIAQCFGSSSSYARKYALNGLFLIDDTKDADATNDHGKNDIAINLDSIKDELTDAQRDELHRLLDSSTYDQKQRDGLFVRINGYTTLEQYNNAKDNLLQNQGGIDTVANPSQKDIKKHIKQLAWSLSLPS